jgi:predicted AAA+ superfamily ATPase
MYYHRTIENTIKRVSNSFKVLLLTGMRQSGKTTLLKHCGTGEAKRHYISLDDVQDEVLAKNEPALFLQTYKPPVLIDEVQYAPELFRYIKILVDNTDERGLVWLAGSQQYNLMAGITESLAGRVVILDIFGFSIYERTGNGSLQKPFLPSLDSLDNSLRNSALPLLDKHETFRTIWQGSFPDIIHKDSVERNYFYSSYIRTYLERDVRQLINVINESLFMRFLNILAARTGQELNLSALARDSGISPNTAKAWLSILETSGIVFLLRPYFRNINKRLSKRPKLYFTDTGLCSYLSSWVSPESLESGSMAGALFENFALMEIIKSWYHNGERPNFYYYRDSNQVEIDLLIERDGVFYPIEIKTSTNPVKADIKAFDMFAQFEKTGYGSLVCLTDRMRPLTSNVNALSIWEI